MPDTEFLAHIGEDGRQQSVRDHLLGVAALARGFAAPFGAGEEAYYAGLCHDLGKYSDAFQKRLRGGFAVDHSTAGAQEAARRGDLPIAFAVAGHHAGLPDGGTPGDPEDAATLQGRLKRRLPDYGRWAGEVELPARFPPPPGDLTDGFRMAFYIRMLFSCLVDADFLDTEAFMQGPAPRGGYEGIPALHRRMRARADAWLAAPAAPLAAKRNEVLRACLANGAAFPPGAYTLTVPTGGGKTFASLAFALEHAARHGQTRVVYVIPYTSIIDQTVEVFGEILGAENVLAHHSGADYRLKEPDEMTPADYRRALAAENWDAPVVVTTAVQFFESLFANRPGRCRKLHNLANSVLIFDEAQTLPLPYVKPCVAAIAELVRRYRATAVLCTATQPALGPLFEEFLPGRPLWEICPDAAALYGALRRVTLRDLGKTAPDGLAERLCDAPQALCVVNRRATAQGLYRALPGEGRYCLTTLLCAADRRRLLAEIRARLGEGRPCRVVATSLIEAGVDVDFPVAYREEAGLDSLLQTAGRCNREGRRAAADSPVYLFRFSGRNPPPAIQTNVALLRATQRRCPDALDLPPAISFYFGRLFALRAGDAPAAGRSGLDAHGIVRGFRAGVAGSPFSFATLAGEFHLINTPTRTVYIPCGAGKALCDRLAGGERSRGLFRKLGPYGVEIYGGQYDALYRAGALAPLDDGSAILTDLARYSPETGLDPDAESGEGIMV